MATPYPWAVVLMGTLHTLNFGTSADRNRRISGMVQTGRESQEFTGDYNDEAYIHWANSEEDADIIMRVLVDRFPQNSYAKVQTKEIIMVPKAPPQRAVYTEKGLIPT